MMPMSAYLTEIEFAFRGLLPLVTRERQQLKHFEKEAAQLKVSAEEHKGLAHVMGFIEGNEGLAAGMRGISRSEEEQRQDMEKQIERLTLQIETHRFSVGSLAGSLLQFGKQGISIVHGRLAACPNGRAIGSQFLKDVIWQGRNQGLHWEDGSFKPPVTNCFNKLAAEISPDFSDYLIPKNMADDVVNLLGWTTFDRFRDDMMTLA